MTAETAPSLNFPGETCIGKLSLEATPQTPIQYFKVVDGGTPNQRSILMEYFPSKNFSVEVKISQ